ncbi:MAG: LCP family protein [Lentihominibacter sp.]|jgi:LCP family protein required for cell wall assembly
MDERERQYREYLALREQGTREREQRESRNGSVENSPYGESEFRRHRLEQQRREQEMQEYLAARESDRNGKARVRRKGKKARRNRKIAGRTAKILAVAAVVCVAALLFFVVSSLNNVTRIDIDQNAIGINAMVDDELSGYRNIAVLGIDARDMENAEPSRCDSIIVASINKETNEIKLFSVFRDTMLDIGGDQGLDKAAHAYYYGEAEQSLYMLNKNLDMNIHDVVVINWKAVADTVDALGGVEIDVEDSALKEMNKYIPDSAKNIGKESSRLEHGGLQTLDGVQAVTYARIRKDAATGDYRRNERMKIVVQAMFDKAKTIDVKGLRTISKDICPQIMTNMRTRQMMGLMLKLPFYEMHDSTTGFPYEVGSWTGAAWYGPPKNLAANVSRLHEQFFDQKGYDPTDDVKRISEEIILKTGIY